MSVFLSKLVRKLLNNRSGRVKEGHYFEKIKETHRSKSMPMNMIAHIVVMDLQGLHSVDKHCKISG